MWDILVAVLFMQRAVTVSLVTVWKPRLGGTQLLLRTVWTIVVGAVGHLYLFLLGGGGS